MFTIFQSKKCLFVSCVLIAFLIGFADFYVKAQQISVAGGTDIVNYAIGEYEDEQGNTHETQSPPVTITVEEISSLYVTPDESTPTEIVVPNETITREFEICNTSNVSDSYTITGLDVNSPAEITAIFYDADRDGGISSGDIEITVNQELANIVDPGSCMKVLVRIDTNDISPNENLTVTLKARSNNTDAVNGQAEDEGTIVNSGGNPANLTDPNDPTLIPSKLVQNKPSYVSSKTEPLEYEISFRNSGDVDARNVVITDELPVELSYIANTLKLDGVSLTDASDSDEGEVNGRDIIVRLSQPLKPNEVARITFKALASGGQAAQGIINVAKVSADNAKTVDTTNAVVVIDPFGTVYAARGGASTPIPGAQVVILTDQNGTPLSIPAGQGFDPNFDNTNPYSTDSEGHFSFGLAPDQLGTVSQPATYYANVKADGFRDRLIKITLSPAGNGLFQMLVESADGLPVAVANGFELTTSIVTISSIADVAFNIPMFEKSIINVTKSVERIQAEIGDIANYRIDVENTSLAPMLDVVVKDTLPYSFSFVEGTAQIRRNADASLIEPTINGNVLDFNIGDVASGERVSITYRVRIGVNAKKGDNYNSALAKGRFPSGEEFESPTTRAVVKVGRGLFSMKQFILGKVFVDENRNNLFDKGEKPIAGARVYLANGNSATTDTQGLYSIPAVSAGSQVIAIDPITLPKGFVLTDQGRRSGKDWTRLLRTPLGGGGMLRQNFALIEEESYQETSEIIKKISNKSVSQRILSKRAKISKETEPIKFTRVPVGEVLIHRLVDGKVVGKSALNLDISVAKGWFPKLELNGKEIGKENIGTTREDKKNEITTYTFVGLGLKPGPNKIKAVAVSPKLGNGKAVTMEIYGRGPAKRIRITSDKNELQASGRDSTLLVIEAYDEWENPAQDSSVMIETSSGRLVNPSKPIQEKGEVADEKREVGLYNGNRKMRGEVTEFSAQQKVELVDGLALVKLISGNRKGKAKIRAVLGQTEAETDVRLISEVRPSFLAGLAELTVGKNAPEMFNRGVNQNVRGRVQFFYKGKVFDDKNMLTLAYDSQEPLNRISGQDRLFQLNPLEHIYPLFGDSSTRFQETESNSKVYARLDRGRSYAMFGDFDPGMSDSRLLGYSRRLTGGKVHLENAKGDYVTVTGAKPDTSYARQIIPGGSLGLVQLDHPEILFGSEVIALEVRDRRNPAIILSREVLSRSVDYNIDNSTGTIFFLRSVPTFDRDLNLIQIVATYEFRSDGMESSVYTARASKNIDRLGLRLGFSYINQKQNGVSPYQLGGLDGTLKLPNRGKLNFEWARSNGMLNQGFSFNGGTPNGSNEFNGDAFFVSLEQPLPMYDSFLRFEGYSASKNFYNPFGATVIPGSTRAAVTLETKPVKNGSLKVNLVGEKNLTDNVDNNRVTAGVKWSQTVSEKLKVDFGYDFRRFSDSKSDKVVNSNLLSLGADWKPTNKLEFAIKREQNLGEEDPSYPSQTLIGASYKFTDFAKLFFTQRIASNPITPISDFSSTGFASSNARYETAIGVETQFGKYTTFSGRYQLENGINGTDSFSIIGLKNRLPINKKVALELGYERAFHLAGQGESYNNFTFGANWLPDEDFRSSFRYELRDRNGFGQLFSLGAAGRLKPGWTTLGNFQYGDIDFNGRKNTIVNGQLALAIRPHDTDKYGVLLSYKHRESFFATTEDGTQNDISHDIFSVDGFHQTTRRLELYGRFATKFTADETPKLPYAYNLSLLSQGRARYQLTRSFDIAGEGRFLYQPYSGSSNRWFGIEGGYWATPELRLAGGYNFSRSKEVLGFNNNNVFDRDGFYFSISSKLSRMFDLFGTKKKGLKHYEDNNRKPNKDVSKNQRK